MNNPNAKRPARIPRFVQPADEFSAQLEADMDRTAKKFEAIWDHDTPESWEIAASALETQAKKMRDRALTLRLVASARGEV
jgi:hypothetical protein